MRNVVVAVLWANVVFVTRAESAAPPISPATSPAAASQPASRAATEPLLDGSIRYAPPPAPAWTFAGKTDDNKKASYMTEEGRGRIDITVNPQTRDVPPEYAKQMALIIGKGIRDDADRAAKTLLMQPRVEKDPRFFLKIHDRFSGEEGIRDRLQLYRVMGLNIVHVAVVALKDTPEEAAPIHRTAEELLADMQLTHGQRWVVYPRNKLKIRPPIDWKETKADVANALVVTYADPKQPERQLILRARVMPRDARTDAAKRGLLIDRMIDDERKTTPFDEAKHVGDDQVVPGGSPREYFRQVRAEAQVEGGPKLRVQTRYFMVQPDVLVSLRSVGAEDDEALLKSADALAVDVKPSRE